MSLEVVTQSVVDQFEYSDENVNKGVQEFLCQMSMC